MTVSTQPTSTQPTSTQATNGSNSTLSSQLNGSSDQANNQSLNQLSNQSNKQSNSQALAPFHNQKKYTQPVTSLTPPDDTVNILQITDLHLLEANNKQQNTADAISNSDESQHHQQHFKAVLAQAMAQNIRCDLILVTGDLVSTIKTELYDEIFDSLQATGVPFACIAGNHDVTDETNKHLPYHQRQLVAHKADARLLNHHVIDTPYWQLLLIDSSVAGIVAGKIQPDTLDWLKQQLTVCQKPALLALHHHVVPMGSLWIDHHIASGADELWQMLAEFSHLKVIVNGHTHQEHACLKQGVLVFATPSTSYQFKAQSQDFALDTHAQAGYRWLQLTKDSTVKSWVERLNTQCI